MRKHSPCHNSYIKKNKIKMSQFYTQAVKEMTFRGKIYGIPMDVDNRSLFYNKTLFANAGITHAPKTWAELEKDAIKLTVWKDGKLVVAGMDLSDCGLFSMWLKQAGGSMVTSNGKKTNFNNSRGEEVLNFWNKLLNVDKVYTVGFDSTGVAAGEDPFLSGKLAMKYDGPWDLAKYAKYAGKLNYGIVTPPAGPNGDKGAIIGGFALAIPSKAKHPQQAFSFIKWWTTIPANGVKFAKLSGNIPANIKAAHEDYFTNNDYYKILVNTMSFATIRPQCLGYADVESEATIPDLQLFMEGKMTAKQALSDAQSKGDTILKKAQAGQ